MKRKVWIDTDAGTDDAVALVMALRHADLEIMGISCVGGNVPLRHVVQNVLYICELCDANTVDVYDGALQPLRRTLGTADFIHGKDGLGDIGLHLSGRMSTGEDAHLHLIDAVTNCMQDLSVIALGPLTNLALAEQTSPGILASAKEVIIMGGLIDLPGNITPRAEFNIWADPEAANVVLSSGAKITMLGWDTTLRGAYWTLDDMASLRKIGTTLSDFVLDIQNVRLKWLEDQGEEPRCILPDPLAMAYYIDPTISKREQRYQLKVGEGLDDDPDRGYMTMLYGGEEDVLFIHDFDRQDFLEMLRRSLE